MHKSKCVYLNVLYVYELIIYFFLYQIGNVTDYSCDDLLQLIIALNWKTIQKIMLRLTYDIKIIKIDLNIAIVLRL